jgi:hypothetical protein
MENEIDSFSFMNGYNPYVFLFTKDKKQYKITLNSYNSYMYESDLIKQKNTASPIDDKNNGTVMLLEQLKLANECIDRTNKELELAKKCIVKYTYIDDGMYSLGTDKEEDDYIKKLIGGNK